MKALLLAAASLALAAASLALAGAAHAQDPEGTPAQQPAGDQTAARALTDDLNGPPAGAQPARTPPPAPAAQPSPPPTSAQPAPQPTSQPVTPARTQPTPTSTQPTPTPTPRPAAPPPAPTQAPPPAGQPAPRTPPPAAAPASQPTPPAATTTSPPPPAATPAPTPAAPVATPPQPVAVDSLPFRIDLPTGFSVFGSQRGDFATYTVRRGDAAYLMVFVGPQSQFPIYDGRLVERGGRSSMIINEDGQDRAVEHLFRNPTSRVETHVLVSTVADDQRAQADAIAQSVDPK